jgi:hypothetical protein
MKFTTKEIKQCAAEILESEPKGIRYADLCKRIQERGPETNLNTIRTQVGYFVTENPDSVTRPSRGVIILKKFASQSDELNGGGEAPAGDGIQIAVVPGQTPRPTEVMFYEPFKDWMVEESEVSVAHVVGGAGFKSKWGTPDVIGVYKQDLHRNAIHHRARRSRPARCALRDLRGRSCPIRPEPGRAGFSLRPQGTAVHSGHVLRERFCAATT